MKYFGKDGKEPVMRSEINPTANSSLPQFLKRTLVRGPVKKSYVALRRMTYQFQLFREFIYDFRRVCHFSSAVDIGDSKMKLQALVTMAYHSIEKGLSLPSPRPGFGKQSIETLLNRLERYSTCYGVDEHCMVSLNVLRSYEKFNHNHGLINRELIDKIITFENAFSTYSTLHNPLVGGTRVLLKRSIRSAMPKNPEAFFETRKSVRQYTADPVSFDIIERAVKLAQQSPSVCNRQSGIVHILNTPAEVQRALEIQDGAKGFSQSIGTLLIISSDLSHFQSAGERNQCWIDGGIFSMSLVYALHSLCLVTCCLNWSKTNVTDQRLKKEFGIPNSESIIMFISVGHPLKKFEVAESWKKPIGEVLIKATNPVEQRLQ